MDTKNAPKARLIDGLVRQNIVLMGGLLISPVIAGATDFEKSVAISVVFSLVTIITIAVCRFIPRKFVYTIRIIAYAVIAAVVYIPVYLLANKIIGDFALSRVGIYIPVLIANPIIISKTETRLFLRPYGEMIKETIGYILGFDAVCLLVGAIRDTFVNSHIGGLKIDGITEIPALETSFGGFFIVGILAALSRALYNLFTESNKT
jgi:electron transport complex protein RnfE